MSQRSNTISLGLPGFIFWLGGAIYVANRPGYDFFDGLVWLYYLGKYMAKLSMGPLVGGGP